nr:ribonuclease H-like domain-containing protein [Tanacetum cinerariifolium]
DTTKEELVTQKEEIELESTQSSTTAKLPLLKQGDYEMRRLRIEQYFQIQDYALWDVIENGPVTIKEKDKKKNDVKARSMLLMALPNEHLMTFNQYKDAKTLFTAIETRFGVNEATKKTLFKQLYENFSATRTESLDLIFNRLQKLVILWSNKSDLDTMSLDDLYNNFKIVEQEVRGTTSTNTCSQNMAFVSSPSPNSTNEVPIVFGNTGKKITINGSDTAGYDKAKVECFNCHKTGHFARECRVPRNQENRTRNQETTRRTVNVEDTSSKAMVAINKAGFDWSYMADDEAPTNIAFMGLSVLEARCKYHQRDRMVNGTNHSKVNHSAHTVPKEMITRTGLKPVNSVRHVNSKRGYVAFGGGAKGGKINGKGTIRTGRLDFEDVYFVKELQFNLFSVSQMILKSFITEIENLVDKKVKIIRCDNGTKFKNRVMNVFCKEKGIKREYNVARTPQQNGVVERRNRTLIEAARTMLADFKLPITFWAEAVNTACYV